MLQTLPSLSFLTERYQPITWHVSEVYSLYIYIRVQLCVFWLILCFSGFVICRASGPYLCAGIWLSDCSTCISYGLYYVCVCCFAAGIVTPTCKVMTNIAQYITVSLANLTNSADSTPDCNVDRKSLCNNITCVLPTEERYSFNFLPCQEPMAVNIVQDFVGGESVSDEVFVESKMFNLGAVSTQLTLNHLRNNTVQFQVRKGIL